MKRIGEFETLSYQYQGLTDPINGFHSQGRNAEQASKDTGDCVAL